jgi:hypothetical protein
MKKKLMYEVPDAELIELKLDANVMQAASDTKIESWQEDDDSISM